jgi:hypothetical protein
MGTTTEKTYVHPIRRDACVIEHIRTTWGWFGRVRVEQLIVCLGDKAIGRVKRAGGQYFAESWARSEHDPIHDIMPSDSMQTAAEWVMVMWERLRGGRSRLEHARPVAHAGEG